MARHNKVELFGIVSADPIIAIDDETNSPCKASLFLTVVNSDRDNGIGGAEIIYSDPFIFSQDPDIVEQIAAWKEGDIVQLTGVLTTLDAKRGARCPKCGKKITHNGEVTFVTPIFVELRYRGLSQAEAEKVLLDHREISNRVTLIGYLCDDVKFSNKAKAYGDIIGNSAYKGIAAYQIAVNRSFYLDSDDPKTRTDYPHIIVVGERAEWDALSIYKGSLVCVEGMIATRRFRKTYHCTDPNCDQGDFDWEERVTEVVSYGTEYLNNFSVISDVESAKEIKEKEALEKAQAAINSARAE